MTSPQSGSSDVNGSMPTAGSGGSGPRRPAPARAPKRRSRVGQVLGITAVLALGAVAIVGGKLYSTLSSFGGGGGIKSVLDIYNDPRKQFPGKGDRVNILLIGKDYSYLWTKSKPAINGSRYSSESRSDSIMMLSLDMANKRVSALSIPRDTWVTAPDGKTGKINGTYRRGGAKLLTETIGQLLGVKPDYYVIISPDAVKTMVNRLGGVEVETIDAMQYHDYAAHLNVNLPAGRQTINGDEAIGFARFREPDIYERDENGKPTWTGRKDSEGNPIFVRRKQLVRSKEEGDSRRMARQQQLIRAMVSKIKAPSNLLQIDNIADTALNQVETNLEKPQLLALASLYRNLQPDQMQSGTLEGHGHKGGTYYFIPDEKKKEAMVAWLLKGDEAAANRLTVVAVQNGTNVRGAARRVAERLREEGFDAETDTTRVPGPTGAAPNAAPPATRVVYGKAAVATRAQRIAQLIGVPPQQVVKEVPATPADVSDKEDDVDVRVILGMDVAAANGERSAKR